MDNFINFYEGNESQLPSNPINGNIYYLKDTNNLVFDIAGERYILGKKILFLNLIGEWTEEGDNFYKKIDLPLTSDSNFRVQYFVGIDYSSEYYDIELLKHWNEIYKHEIIKDGDISSIKFYSYKNLSNFTFPIVLRFN